jgi:hypothetical protein
MVYFHSSNTLFNYPSFIRRLDMHKVCSSIKKWIAAFKISATKESYIAETFKIETK